MPKIDLEEMRARFRVPPGKRLRLKDYDPGWAGDESLPKKERKEFAETVLTQDIAALAAAQELLWASDSWSVLVVLQAMDAAGKDGTIKHVMSGVNPQGCRVISFKQPSAEELDHNFLWRCMKALPERGCVGIFNRSYYEEVLVVKVHPELVLAEKLPDTKVNDAFWKARCDDINALERHLTRNGTVVVKFFLYVSREEQKKRFLERINNPDKHWKFSPSDVTERRFWDDYMAAYEACLQATSTDYAPWYIIPADHKWVSRALVANILASTIGSLGLRYPEVTEEKRKAIKLAKKQLESET